MSTTLVSSEVCQWLALTWLGIEVMFWFIATTDWRRSMDVLSQAPEYRMDPEELIKRVLDDAAGALTERHDEQSARPQHALTRARSHARASPRPRQLRPRSRAP